MTAHDRNTTDTMSDTLDAQVPFRFKIASIVCSVLIATWTIGMIDDIHATRLEEMTVGQLTTGYGADDKKVLCVDVETSQPCLSEHSGWGGNTVLWLGNSQLPTINQQQPGDKTMVELLHQSLIKNDQYVFGFAPPNANLQEHYLLFEHLKGAIQPDVLLLPVFFDDLRESGIRPGLATLLQQDPVMKRLAETDIGELLLQEHVPATSGNGPAEKMAVSTMDLAEQGLNQWLESSSEAWSKRGDYRSTVFVKMHHLRNAAFQIDPQTVRKMIPARYERNMQALDAIIASANAAKIEVILYIPPIRSDVAIPYDMAAYEQFKLKLRDIADENHLALADLENVVGADEWGTKKSATLGGGDELDFMHFSYAGHRKMAASLEKTLLTESRTVSNSKSKFTPVSSGKVLQ